MNFQRPFQVVGPTLDGDALCVLAGTVRPLTGREVHRLVGHSSEVGVRRALERLVRQGIVHRETVGRSHLYRLNREHVAAQWIEGLAGVGSQLIERFRNAIGRWGMPPAVAVLFGSAVRGEASPESDLDVLLIRPTGIDADDPGWREQVAKLEAVATAWTGNDARVLEYGEDELGAVGLDEPALRAAAREGIELYGPIQLLRGVTKPRRRR